MLKIRHLFLLLALASPFAAAVNGIFWQPQLRDSSVSAARWQALMQTLRRDGFDTLIVQWTAWGSAFDSDARRQALQQRAAAARAAGLRVIVGLRADPDFFQRQKQPPAALRSYLGRLRVADIAQAKRWASAADGWYISAEIDDLNWRGPAARRELLSWLSATRRQLAAVGPQPVYISSFFAGNMTPEGYRQLVDEVRNTGVAAWIQDGRGASTLTPAERQRYLSEAAGCGGRTPAGGVVYELFATRPGATFSAAPLPAAELAAQRAQRSACGKDNLYFSLRYLPAARGVLSAE
ncbi:hypothetical protein ABW09_19030 [Pluralibacter gergoviae]|uniref:DUF4434 family protein n=1 Tax=Pluralibacter gergoviae TaxID=61647 RepID=UPI00065009AE|nr:DUF4434 family protein [Pluralibacter gergoviae]KMK16866.1 hypothetical protein ABW09_19030 [Pluralibacter gergoviae]